MAMVCNVPFYQYFSHIVPVIVFLAYWGTRTDTHLTMLFHELIHAMLHLVHKSNHIFSRIYEVVCLIIFNNMHYLHIFVRCNSQDIGNKSLFRKHCMNRHFDMDWGYIDLHLKNRKVSN
jgi:hypothetical protein